MTTETQQQNNPGVGANGDRLMVTDTRTGKQYEFPIEDGAIRATELRKIKVSDDDFGLLSYDPAYMATASCRSSITFIDGERGTPARTGSTTFRSRSVRRPARRAFELARVPTSA